MRWVTCFYPEHNQVFSEGAPWPLRHMEMHLHKIPSGLPSPSPRTAADSTDYWAAYVSQQPQRCVCVCVFASNLSSYIWSGSKDGPTTCLISSPILSSPFLSPLHFFSSLLLSLRCHPRHMSSAGWASRLMKSVWSLALWRAGRLGDWRHWRWLHWWSPYCMLLPHFLS